MKRFAPHEFSPTVSLLSSFHCSILITPETYQKMYYLAKHNKDEVGWLCTVDRKDYQFTLTDVVLYKQETSGATTEISPEGLTETTMEMLNQPNGVEKVNSLRCWGHVHPNFSVEPSGQDDKQLMEFAKNDCEYFIRIIVNKLGKMKATIVLFKENLKIDDVPWEIAYPFVDNGIEAAIKAEITAKVKEKTYASSKSFMSEHWHDRDHGGSAYPFSRGYGHDEFEHMLGSDGQPCTTGRQESKEILSKFNYTAAELEAKLAAEANRRSNQFNGKSFPFQTKKSFGKAPTSKKKEVGFAAE